MSQVSTTVRWAGRIENHDISVLPVSLLDEAQHWRCNAFIGRHVTRIEISTYLMYRVRADYESFTNESYHIAT